MCACGELAAKHDCRLHTHLAETHDEDEFCRARFGFSPVDYLEEVGWLNDRTWLAHGIHFSDGEIDRLAKSGVSVCHCPTSNMVLALAIAARRNLRKQALPLGWGGRWFRFQ